MQVNRVECGCGQTAAVHIGLALSFGCYVVKAMSQELCGRCFVGGVMLEALCQ